MTERPQVITDTKRVLLIHDGWAVGSIPYMGGVVIGLQGTKGQMGVTLPIRSLCVTMLDIPTGKQVVMQIGAAILPHLNLNFSDLVPCMWGKFGPGGERLPAPDALKKAAA